MSVIYDLSTSHNQKKSLLTAFGVYLRYFPPLFSLQAPAAKIAPAENATQHVGGCKKTARSLCVAKKEGAEGGEGPGGAPPRAAPARLLCPWSWQPPPPTLPRRSLRRLPLPSRSPASCQGLWGKAALCQPSPWNAGGLQRNWARRLVLIRPRNNHLICLHSKMPFPAAATITYYRSDLFSGKRELYVALHQ